MFRHLVVPVDGSPASLAALPVALRLAKDMGAAVEVVGVYDLNDVTLVKERVRVELEQLGATTAVAFTLFMSSEPAAEVIGELARSRPGSVGRDELARQGKVGGDRGERGGRRAASDRRTCRDGRSQLRDQNRRAR